MNRKKQVTAEERALFFAAVKNVKPLKGSRKPIFLATPPSTKPPSTPTQAVSSLAVYKYPPVDLELLAPEDWVSVEESIQLYPAQDYRISY